MRIRRLPPSRDGRPGVIFGQPDDPHVSRANITLLGDYAFWAWASIQVLRHTSMRIREMLELRHRSFVAYTLPGTDEVIPLPQVTPSKTDSERLLVVSPELSEALAAIIARVRGGNDHIPLVSRYGGAERLRSPALPFLYQRPHRPRQHPVSTMFIKQLWTVSSRSTRSLPLTAARAVHPARLSPDPCHRRRGGRVAGANPRQNSRPRKRRHHPGLRCHLYDEVIEHYPGFIARRRSLRPTAEYREPTDAEWDDFIGYSAMRKVELGVCGRAYGTRCQHEHACVRCPMLRPDPAQRARLVEIIANLSDRLTEARERDWHGELEVA